MSATSKLIRRWAFLVSVVASVIALLAIPFYEHWFSKLGYAALASDTMHIWLDTMLTVSFIALFGSLFGRGAYRVVALFLGLAELYYWFVLSIAV